MRTNKNGYQKSVPRTKNPYHVRPRIVFGTRWIQGWWYKLIWKTSLLNSFYSKLWTLNLDITCYNINQAPIRDLRTRGSRISGQNRCWWRIWYFWWPEIFEVGIFLMTKRIIRDESIPIFELGSNKFHHLKQLLNLELLETCCQLSFGLI